MRLTVPLPPVHYQRPRPGGKGFYSPHTPTLNEWQLMLRNQMRLGRHEMIEGPVSVTLLIGAESTELQVIPALGVARPEGVRADLDNIAKFDLDALQEVAYFDDKQVVHVAAQFTTEGNKK